MSDVPLLEVRGLTVRIGGQWVCRNLDLLVAPGERWGILGCNGVGKTTLLLTLAGIRPALVGEVWLRGERRDRLSRREAARRLGLMPQDSADLFPATVLEIALAGRHPHLPPWQWETPEDGALAYAALQAVGLEGFARRQVRSLSGGERRRLALAMLMTQDPSLWLLDEPTNHLDVAHQMQAVELIATRIARGGQGVLMTLHDINLAVRCCDRILLLFGDGETAAGPTAQILTEPALSRLYRHPVRSVMTESGLLFYPT